MAYNSLEHDDNCYSTIDENIFDDTSIIPLEKDSFAICELCGRVGRRGQFYPRNNKFCSLRCNASFSRRKHINWRFKLMEGTDHMAGMIPLEPLPQLQQWHATLSDLQAGPIKQSAASVANSYEWKDELFGCDFLAAPVSLFKHAPLHEMWDNTFEGMKVEVKNTDCDNYSEKLSDYFWVATVLKVKGYMGLLRYEGFGSDDSKDFWVNLCCSEVHPVGWCATRGKPLIPPRTIEDKYTDWKKFLVKQLTGARTLPANFYSKLNDSLVSRFSIGSLMEVVDKNRISQVKVATVCEIVGKRLHVKYYDSSPEDNGFWCHEDSPLIHPVGWAFRIGHPLDAPQNYCERVATGRLFSNDSTNDMFYKYPSNEPPLFMEGMKIEAIDPLNLSAVCAATVMQILNEGYMMIRIDCYPADANGADWFCYHQRSPCIFPVGFAMANSIPLVPPAGFLPEEFQWEDYLAMTGSIAADRSLFSARGHVVSHGFVAGMRLECADLMDPRLVCVATIARVVADLLKVHFDGWGSEYDQWLWAHSTDVYPVGWCRAIGHRLEGPLQPPPRVPRKNQPRQPKKKRRQVTKVAAHTLNSTEESSQNSDIGETKSLSPQTSVSEVSMDAEAVVPKDDQLISEVNMELQQEQKEKTPEKPNVSPISPRHDFMEDIPMQDEKPSIPEESPSKSSEGSSKEEEEDPDKVIPRLVNTTVPLDILNSVDPENWTAADVAKFLTVNDCQTYCVNFCNITGPMLLQLSKDEIIELLEMKVGPSLKIFDLIQQLKCKIKQPQCRMLVNFK
ncbi:polycomb protein Sfmbt-like isoform X2 [Bombyx mandarina]|uniref:Polycomb protein Sfmbt-like isoform X1 n=2 Tax=Bombyx TaxID=7090 RepID=A0A6J2KMW9_BOMMA|nr:polycomb protein Sfmbt-like isoform X1 [Bombyx mandarina]XP_028042323.1 polycomb protein Sfmbt-like isoform X2 [Bombyx mandarina]